MDIATLVLIVTFVVLLILNVPIAFALGVSALLAIVTIGGMPFLITIAHRMATSIDEFALLAIPFFILAGLFMGRGGIARRLIDFANTLVGRAPGGLSYVNILTCMLFGAISGSAVAAVSSVGGFMIPLMNKEGYHRDFNASVSITAATTGLLIPPSNVMIVYSLATGGIVSIAAIFLAGFIPGILMGIGLMVVSGIISLKRKYGKGIAYNFKEGMFKFLIALPPLFLIVLVLGGILSGIFTATEAAAIAVVYAFILSVFVYREVKLKEIPQILLQCGITTSVVMLLIATSTALSEAMTLQHIPQSISDSLLGISSSKIIILLIINLILLFVGTFMDMTPAVLIFTPIFLPIVNALGVNPIHFGIIMIMNLCIGVCTPPVGTCLFVGCGIAETTVTKIMKYIIPFFIAMIVVLLIVTYISELSLLLPRMFGY